MSRGLGKIQWAILQELRRSDCQSISELASRIYHPDWYNGRGELQLDDPEVRREAFRLKKYIPGPASREIVSVSRAVKSLERQGLVTVGQGLRLNPQTYKEDGRLKFVKLSDWYKEAESELKEIEARLEIYT